MRKTNYYFFSIFFPALLLLRIAFAGENNIALHDAWISEAPPGVSVLAGYVMIHNVSEHEQILQEIKSDMFERIEIHKSVMKDGMASMEQQRQIEIPAGESFNFEPGGYHLMLFNPETTLKAGDSVPLEFIFADMEPVKIDAEVRKLQQHDHQHHH